MAARRYGTIVGHLKSDPETAVELAAKLPDDTLHHLATALADEARNRAVKQGDEDAIIADAFDCAFGRDGLGVLPWIEGHFIVCPGAIESKNRSSHLCRFVSVDDTWIWDSEWLIREDKRSTPGPHKGFRAVALLPIVEGMELDVVSARQRGGAHGVERVVSLVIKRGELIEVSQRVVTAAGMQ